MQPIKVGVVTDVGQLEDKSFNQSSNEGAKAAAEASRRHARRDRHPEHLGLRREHPDVRRPGLRRHRDRRLPPRAPTPPAAAKANPDIKFVGVDQGICVDEQGVADPTFACAGDAAALLPNYQGIVFAEAQPGYLAGIVAASITESGTIGAVGGTNVPAVVNYWRGYENGAKSVNPDVEVLYQETDPDPAKGFNDPTKGRADRRAVHRPGRRRDLPDRRPHRPGRPRGRLRRGASTASASTSTRRSACRTSRRAS